MSLNWRTELRKWKCVMTPTSLKWQTQPLKTCKILRAKSQQLYQFTTDGLFPSIRHTAHDYAIRAQMGLRIALCRLL